MAKKYFDNMPEVDVVALKSSLGCNIIPPLPIEHPYATNPVLNGSSVTDRTAQGVADPFIVQKDGILYMFFEVITATTEEIGYATSTDGLVWTYGGICLTEEGQHFAYPFVFKHGNDYYMIPDKGTKCDIYKATTFPTVWVLEKTLINAPIVDGTPFFYNGNWYLHARESTGLELYVTNDLLSGTWTKHPQSPLSVNAKYRGAGRPIVNNHNVFLPIQDYYTAYGEFARWCILSNLTPTTVTFTESHIIFQRDYTYDETYATRGRHHIDIIGDLCVVDAISQTGTNNWSIGVFAKSYSQKKATTKITNNGGNQTLTEISVWQKMKAGETGADLIFDNSYMYDVTNKHFVIPKTGYYRVSVAVSAYAVPDNTYMRLRIRNKVDDSVIVQCGNTGGPGIASQPETLQIYSVFYLTQGMQLVPELYANQLIGYMTGEENVYMLIEEV